MPNSGIRIADPPLARAEDCSAASASRSACHGCRALTRTPQTSFWRLTMPKPKSRVSFVKRAMTSLPALGAVGEKRNRKEQRGGPSLSESPATHNSTIISSASVPVVDKGGKPSPTPALRTTERRSGGEKVRDFSQKNRNQGTSSNKNRGKQTTYAIGA